MNIYLAQGSNIFYKYSKEKEKKQGPKRNVKTSFCILINFLCQKSSFSFEKS